ncbi:hypothetical protein [Peribacillus frigoritolerans]|uniref:Uncharacterized protein n=1 Tax=Peribacillus castrilensis TaxID=2897690 RepID=A0AAW9NGF3_9BACI|nr:hypothetical protein [Peribacillus castrilensis]
MKKIMFKPEYITMFLGCLLGIGLLIGISSRLFSMKEIVSFFLIISLLFVLSIDIKKGAFKKKKNKFPIKYFVLICLFCLLTIN